MPTRIIAEVGSTHMGNKEYGLDLIEACADMGVDAVKFQLFPDKSKYTEAGNVYLSPDLFLEFKQHAEAVGLECSASVFDEDSFEFLIAQDPSFIKFAYSQKDQRDWIRATLAMDIEAIVSCDVMSVDDVPKKATKLFCLPQYPVYHMIDFMGLFPRFDGFSSHTLHFGQDIDAIEHGAKILEKHITHPKATCPDARFALSLGDFQNMVTALRLVDRRVAS